jgi:hypothetical protein
MLACIDKDEDPDNEPGPNDTENTDDTGDTGTEELTDFDHDGYFSDVDCDDNNALVYPDAEETCDDIDNDCDKEVDEGFDSDGDGYNNMVDCASGDDCDDEDDDIYPGAEETAYDYIDQDCDGTDLTDVDADGFEGEAIGGNDCDDWDATVYPGAEEVVKDGIDQDCDGQDNIDSDGDGYGDSEWGGDDCDDEDPEVNPGAPDFSNDDIDTNCDDDPDTVYELESATIAVSSSPYEQALVGSSVLMCDLDEDGYDELIVGAPFDNNYGGRVGIWYGSDHADWSMAMDMEDADTLISGDTYGFLGFYVLCEDFDGDGHQDLVLQRGEIDYASTYVTDWSLVYFYGDGSGFNPSLTDSDADAELVYELGVPTETASVYSNHAETVDLDGDGAAEIILTMGSSSFSVFDGEDRVVVVPGGAYTEDGNLSEQITHMVAAHTPYQLSRATPLSDLDGDGAPDLAIMSYGWASNYDDASDEEHPDYGEYLWEGRVDFIASLPEPGEDHQVEDLSWGSHEASRDQFLYGYTAIDGDFDGDGLTDLVVSLIGETPNGSENGGGIMLFSDAASDLGSSAIDPEDEADAVAYGDIQSIYLGYDLDYAGDVNGDGYDDFIVSAPGFAYTSSDGISSYPSSSGWVYLVSGALFTGEVDNLRDVSLLAWQGEDTTYDTGSKISAQGDIDGDGIQDILIGEQSWGTKATTGKAYVYLSSQF